MMSPASTRQLGVSLMNFFGISSRTLRHMMQDKNVETFESLISLAEELGATMYSCAMSRDVMGIQPEELRDGTGEAGVAASWRMPCAAKHPLSL